MAGILEKCCLRKKIGAALRGKSGKKRRKKTHDSLSNFSNNASLSLSLSRVIQAQHAGTVLSLSRHSQASFSLSHHSLRRRSLYLFAFLRSPPLTDAHHHREYLFSLFHSLSLSIAPHHWLCDCRFLLLTVNSCSWISLLLLIFMRVLWVLCWVCREVSFLGS